MKTDHSPKVTYQTAKHKITRSSTSVETVSLMHTFCLHRDFPYIPKPGRVLYKLSFSVYLRSVLWAANLFISPVCVARVCVFFPSFRFDLTNHSQSRTAAGKSKECFPSLQGFDLRADLPSLFL